MKRLVFGLLVLSATGVAALAQPAALPTVPTPGLPIVNPTSAFKLPEKPPPPTGKALMLQIIMALVTVGGCALGGTVLVVMDAKYEKNQDPQDGERLKTIRSIEYGFLGVIVAVGGALLLYAGFQLLKSAGIL